MTTTVEELEEQLSNTTGELVMISMDEESDIPGLTGVVQRSMARCSSWEIRWPDESAPIEKKKATSKQLLDLIKAVGNYHGLAILNLYLPFTTGMVDLTKVAKALPVDGNCIEKLCVEDSEFVPKKAGADDYSKYEAEKDVLGFLEKVSKWKLLKRLLFWPRLCLDPAFLSKVALALPRLEHLEEMYLKLENPPDYNPTDTVYTEHLHAAFDQLKEGLDSNYSLKTLHVLTYQNEKLQAQLTTLGTEKFGFLLHLNELGRKDIATMPFHLETWLEMLPMRTMHLSDIYYYLHKNTWMFTPVQDLAKENKELRDELQINGKRHREEIEAKDDKIQRLLKALQAKEEEHKAEIQRLTTVQHPCNQSGGADGSF